jgi:pantothenate kinase
MPAEEESSETVSVAAAAMFGLAAMINSYLTVSSRQVVDAIREWQIEASAPLVVTIDGHGASGKSTLAQIVGQELGATVVHTDDFFRPSDPQRPRTAASQMSEYYDWERLRREAMTPLLAGQTAAFRAFDEATDSFKPGMAQAEPADLILLEGVSSTTPELSDIVDRTVLVQTPEPERTWRLMARVTPEIWDDNWLAAERGYFATRPAHAFDLVVSGSTTEPAEVSR